MAAPAKDESSAPAETNRLQGYQLALLTRLLGKKVSVSTADLHHAVGRLESVSTEGLLRLSVAGHPVLIRRAGLVRIHEADPALAEYVK